MKFKLFMLFLVILILLIFNRPFKKISYIDNSNMMKCIIQIDNNNSLQLVHLYNERIDIAYQDGLWKNALLTSIVIMRENIIQPIIIKKCTITLYDNNGNIIPFKRIDWYKGGAIADKNMEHFKDESELLKVNSKMYGEDIYYVYEELGDVYEKLRMEYHFIFEISGKTYEIKDSKDLHRKSKWIFITPFDI